MHPNQHNEIVTALFEEAVNVMTKKSHDYASDVDTMSNFKSVAKMAGVPVEKVFMVFLATKVARLGELTNGKTPNNESISDSLIDLINYSALFEVYRNEI